MPNRTHIHWRIQTRTLDRWTTRVPLWWTHRDKRTHPTRMPPLQPVQTPAGESLTPDLPSYDPRHQKRHHSTLWFPQVIRSILTFWHHTLPIVKKLTVTFLNPTHATIRSMLVKCGSHLQRRWMFWFWISCRLSTGVWNPCCGNCASQILSH